MLKMVQGQVAKHGARPLHGTSDRASTSDLNHQPGEGVLNKIFCNGMIAYHGEGLAHQVAPARRIKRGDVFQGKDPGAILSRREKVPWLFPEFRFH
jgi:hypothetical protein